MSAHDLSPIPQRLARLLVKSPDRRLAQKVETWLGKNSNGLYPFIHLWLDAPASENIELRRTLGAKVCEIIESGATNLLEE